MQPSAFPNLNCIAFANSVRFSRSMACQAAASTGLSRCCHTVQRGAINHSKLGRELQALWGKVAGEEPSPS